MRFYNFIFYCLHSLLPGQKKSIRNYRYLAGYILTFLTVTFICCLYGLYVLQFPDRYSNATFGAIFWTTFIIGGLFNYRISKSKELFKKMIDENKPTTTRHKIIGVGLIVVPIIAFGTIGYLIRH
jgi:uncharacterized BrkB/YihY/UPF0761 family membrane protein